MKLLYEYLSMGHACNVHATLNIRATVRNIVRRTYQRGLGTIRYKWLTQY